jgi:hypothetical protein
MTKKKTTRTAAPVKKATEATTKPAAAPAVDPAAATTGATTVKTATTDTTTAATTAAKPATKPAAAPKAAKVEVTVAAPFYDLKASKTRKVGETYSTSEARATELRGRKLVK